VRGIGPVTKKKKGAKGARETKVAATKKKLLPVFETNRGNEKSTEKKGSGGVFLGEATSAQGGKKRKNLRRGHTPGQNHYDPGKNWAQQKRAKKKGNLQVFCEGRGGFFQTRGKNRGENEKRQFVREGELGDFFKKKKQGGWKAKKRDVRGKLEGQRGPEKSKRDAATVGIPNFIKKKGGPREGNYKRAPPWNVGVAGEVKGPNSPRVRPCKKGFF